MGVPFQWRPEQGKKVAEPCEGQGALQVQRIAGTKALRWDGVLEQQEEAGVAGAQ